MKKFCVFLTVFILFSTNTVSAKTEFIKNYYSYRVLDQKVEVIAPKIKDLAQQKYVEITPVNESNYTYYYINKDKEAFYVRFYPADDNTNIFVVANRAYDKQYNGITDALQALNLPFENMKDKASIQEYKDDFITLTRKKSLEGFYVVPDGLKPLKIGMKKLNDKLAKHSKKTSAIPYTSDENPINLTCIDTQTFNDTEAQVSIIKKEYRLKNKQNKYVHAFEYVVTNNSTTDAVMQKVSSERLAGMKDIATETFIDLDKIDLIDLVGSFPPVLVVTAGTSIICSVPNWVRMAKVTKESVRYAHMLPENYPLKGKDKMRILVMKYKDDPKPLNFVLDRNGRTFNFSF